MVIVVTVIVVDITIIEIDVPSVNGVYYCHSDVALHKCGQSFSFSLWLSPSSRGGTESRTISFRQPETCFLMSAAYKAISDAF